MTSLRSPPTFLRRALMHGLSSGMLSLVVLARWGRRDTGSPYAPLNAPMHWIAGDKALRQDEASVRYTAGGVLIHLASATLWGAVYERIRRARARRHPLSSVIDAAAVTAVAGVVDLRLVPERLTPGFQRRLSASSTGLVYASFAIGLALTGLILSRRPGRAALQRAAAAQL